MLETFLPILNTGAVGAMLVVMVKWIKAKDRKSYELVEAQNKERKEMHASMTELVKEVTIALTNKNNTDDKMAEAVKKLTDQLRDMKQVIKDNTTRESS